MDTLTKDIIDGIYDMIDQHNKITKDISGVLEEDQKQLILLHENLDALCIRVEEIENRSRNLS